MCSRTGTCPKRCCRHGRHTDLTKRKQELVLRKPICPYICSTHEDFEEERAFLHQKIFPNIDAFCKQRGTHFSPVDIPWTAKDSQVESGHLLPLCLESITNCMPYFICMLGERYGPSRPVNAPVLPKTVNFDYMEKADWLEKNYILSAFGGHKWVLQEAHQFSSFIELQIIQAAFLGNTDFCNFYFRQPEHVDAKGTHLPVATRSKYLRRFEPENEYSALKIRDLKQRIVKKGLTVKYFRTLEDLGNLIVNDWTAVIDLLLPPMFDDDHYFTSAGYIEWQTHEGFAESRRRLYTSTPEIKDTLRRLTEFAVSCLDEPVNDPVESFTHRAHSFSKFIKKKETVPSYRSTLVLTGDRGSGKTTILSNWLQDFSEENPHIPVIRHFVGCNSHSSDISIFLQHCTQFLREQYFDLGDCESKMAASESIQLQSFPEYVEAFLFAAGLGPCVLVLDGIDELSGTNGISPREVKTLSWLPVPLPPQCRLIVSTTQSDLTYKALAKRSDAIILSVPSLDSKQFRISFLEDSMGEHFPLLNRESTKQVLDLDMSTKPLFLEILSSEMKCFNIYSKLYAFLEATEEIHTVRAFWNRSLHRWIREYSWTLESIATDSSASVDDRDFIGWLPDALRLLAMSRDGLRQSEILDLLEAIGYTKETKVTSFHWLLFRQNLGAAIYEKPDGLLAFSHQHVKEIIEYLLLRSVQGSGAENVPKLSKKKLVKKEKQIFQSHLARYFLHQSHSWRRTFELPWQLMMAGDLEMLSKVIQDSQIFMQLVDERDPKSYKDLTCYCDVLRKDGTNLEDIFLRILTSNGLAGLPDKMQVSLFDEQNIHEEHFAKGTQVPLFTPVIPKILTEHASDQSIEDEGIYLTEVDWSATKDDHASPEPSIQDHLEKRSVGKQRDSSDMSLAIISNKLSSSLSSSVESLLPEEPTKIVSLAWQCAKLVSCLGFSSTAESIYIALSQHLSKNYPLHQEEQLIHIRVELALGYLYKEKGDNWSTEHVFDKALAMVGDMYDVAHDASVYWTIQYLKGELSCCLGTLHMEAGDLYKAEDMLKEALEIVDQGRNVPVKATILLGLGRLRLKQEDFVRAETALQKSLLLREQLYGKSHPQVAEVLHSLAGLICHSANQKGYVTQDGELLYRRELEIRQRFLGKDHILVAATLVELGLLMKKESSLSAKTEAVTLLKEALDIRTTKLGGDHPQTKGVRICLTNLEVAIKLGQYEFGKARPSDNRTLERPYSSMSWRDKDVINLDNKAKRNLSRCSKTPSDTNRPFSKDSDLRRSGTESQGSGPIDRENQLDGRMRLLNRETTQSKIRSMSAVPTEDSTLSKAPKKRVTISIKLENNDVDEEDINPPPPQDLFIESYADNPIAPQRPKGVKTLRISRPLSAPFKLHQRFGSAGSYASLPAFKSVPKRTKSRVGSGRSSRMTSMSFYSEASCGSHKMNCEVPGSDSVVLADAQTVHGPHSTLISLLGPAPCPRNKPNGDQHKAAWYHVPGRYQTKETRYPPKRNQIRPDIRNLQANMMIDALRQKDESENETDNIT